MLDPVISKMSLTELHAKLATFDRKKMGLYGGRKFIVIANDGMAHQFAMKDMLKHIQGLAKNELSIPEKKAVGEITSKLEKLNRDYKVTVKEHGFFRFIFTKLKQLANIGFSKTQLFEKLHDKATYIEEDKVDGDKDKPQITRKEESLNMPEEIDHDLRLLPRVRKAEGSNDYKQVAPKTLPQAQEVPTPVNAKPQAQEVPTPVNAKPQAQGVPTPVNAKPQAQGVPTPVNAKPQAQGVPTPANKILERLRIFIEKYDKDVNEDNYTEFENSFVMHFSPILENLINDHNKDAVSSLLNEIVMHSHDFKGFKKTLEAIKKEFFPSQS